MSSPFAAVAGGVRVRVRLTPKGGADRIDGVGHDAMGRGHLRARVAAAPEGGKANAALARLIAGVAGVAPSRATVVQGAKDRTKTVLVEGDPEVLLSRLATITEGPS
ncbi:MAG: DUF167 family protein [Alphaproteobacteria bacterium]